METAAGDIDPKAVLHHDWIRGIAFSPDGRQFASVGWDSCLVEWGWIRAKGHVRPTEIDQGWSVAYSPDGSMLATGSGTGVIRIYRPKTDASPLVLRGHSMPVTQILFSPDGQEIISAGHDRTVREWDTIWIGQPRLVCGQPDWIRCLALSPRGDVIAVGGDAPGIAVKSRDGATVADLRGHEQPVTALAFTPDGRTLVSAGRDGVVHLWDVATGSRATRSTGDSARCILSRSRRTG